MGHVQKPPHLIDFGKSTMALLGSQGEFAMSELLTLAEVAERLRISQETARRLVRSGRLVPDFAVSSKCLRFTLANVERQLAGSRPTPPAHNPAA
jgi:Helix-turn-helix domain